MKATAQAHPNIALVKYWGKRDEDRVLPHQSSFSITLAPLSVRATVDWGVDEDRVEINGRAAAGKERQRVLSLVRRTAAAAGLASGYAKVTTAGDFPAGAGLASSAAAFAALAIAARSAAGLPPGVQASSVLARIGSGSACRSIQGGFCLWRKGTSPGGEDSHAEQCFDAGHWPSLRLLVAIVDRNEKEVSSREAMARTVRTSPFYPAWVSDAEAEVPRAVELVKKKDLAGLGELCERNALRMHATALGAEPPVVYFKPGTLGVIESLHRARRAGLPAWFTIDAGPNPVLITEVFHAKAAAAAAREGGAETVIECRPGGDATLLSDHLF